MRIFLAVLMCGAAFAETNAQAPVIGMLNYIHAVGNLERTLAFYHDVFGLEPNGGGPRPFPNPVVPILTNSPGATLRIGSFKIPNAGFGYELTDFMGIERKGAQALPTDPGAAEIVFRVKSLDPVIEAAKKLGTPMVSRGGDPVKNGANRLVLMRDPDGYLVEALETAPPPGVVAAGNVFGGAMGLTVNDMEATLKFYRDLLGFDLKGKMDYSANPAIVDLVGAPSGAESRVQAGVVPGTNARIEFHEWKGLKRTPFNLRVADPGSPAVALRVTDLDGLLAKMKAAHVKIVTAGGKPTEFSKTTRNIFVEDPNGFKIELYESAQ